WQNVFSLDPRSGQFTLSKRLDYETDPEEYVVYAQVNDGKFNSTVSKVVFRLINLPDNPPKFDSNLYKLEVMENRIYAGILCLTATDADLVKSSSPNGGEDSPASNLTYYIDFSSFKSIKSNVEIDPFNGCISIVKPFDREEIASV